MKHKAPELFEVTTSSALNVLTPEFAWKWASLRPDKKSTRLEGINGKVSAASAGQVNLEFANLHFGAIRMVSFDETRPSDGMEISISGYLGFELLRSLHLRIDYRDGLIHFDYDQKHE